MKEGTISVGLVAMETVLKVAAHVLLTFGAIGLYDWLVGFG